LAKFNSSKLVKLCISLGIILILFAHKYNLCKFVNFPISIGITSILLLFKYNEFKFVKFPISIGITSILLHLWTFKMPILVFIIFVFSYLIFLNIFGLSIICSI
jgi:hypothetical protein